jgi:hypothetical protein
MSYNQWQREGRTIDSAWDVLSIVKGGFDYGGGVESIGGTCGGSRV